MSRKERGFVWNRGEKKKKESWEEEEDLGGWESLSESSSGEREEYVRNNLQTSSDFKKTEDISSVGLGRYIEVDEDGDPVTTPEELEEMMEEAVEEELSPFEKPSAEEDLEKFKYNLHRLKYPAHSNYFLYFGFAWTTFNTITFARLFPNYVLKVPDSGKERFTKMLDYMRRLGPRYSRRPMSFALLYCSVAWTSSFFFEPGYYIESFAFSVATLAYWRKMNPRTMLSSYFLGTIAIFTLGCAGVDEMRRLANGYYGSEPLIKFLSYTTHNPYLRDIVDTHLGLTDKIYPNFWGNKPTFFDHISSGYGSSEQDEEGEFINKLF